LIALCFAALLLGLGLVLFPSETAAASHTKDIRGYAYDSQYNRIPNIWITVTVLNPGNPVSRSEYTDDNGYFNVQFAATEWNQGRTVRVVATYKTDQTTNETLILDNTYFQWGNATAFSYEIPQFGSTAGMFLTAGVIGVVAVTVMFWKRR
jgi:hypothetical protein